MTLVLYLLCGSGLGFLYSACSLAAVRPNSLLCMAVGAMIADILYIAKLSYRICQKKA